ncbi:MAG: hypothetical protein WCJ51_00170 [Candidatus Moraniibacteriota bacterium]
MFEIWMNWNFKNKNISQRKKTKGLLMALFLMVVFLTGSAESLKAADTTTVPATTNQATATVAPAVGSSIGAIAQPETKTVSTTLTEKDRSIWKDMVSNPFFLVVKTVLFGILQLVGYLFGIVGTLFQWAVDPVNISGAGGLLNKQTVRDVWIMVRDTLNMTFIMILLFSAFCTVFQVDSWSLKKVWLNILINALLVNFSFPIARLFIDISNVAMYYFLNHLFSGTGQGSGSAIMAGFGDMSNLVGILLPNGYADAEIAYLLAAIAFSFILGITLLVLAALFVVRLIALCLIVMFSPIGFVGFIFPAMSKYASQWWDNLFKYAFFGPVMVFMMMVSMQMMRAMGSENISNFKAAASMNTTSAGQANWIASSAFFFIPVGILWIAMGIANSMNIAFSKEIVGMGQKVGKWAGNLPLKGIKTGVKAIGNQIDRKVLKSWSPRAIKTAWDARNKDIENKHLSVATGAWHDRLNAFYRSGKTNYRELAEHQIIAKRQKELIDGGIEESEDEFLQMEKLVGKDTPTAQVDLQAMMRNQIARNDHNDFMRWIQGHVDGNTELGKKFRTMGINENNYEIENGDVAHAMDAILKASGVDEEHRNTHLQDVGSIAVAKGGIMYGLTRVNSKTGKREKVYTVSKDASGVDSTVDDGWASQVSVAKLMTTPDAQNIPKSLHPNYSSNRAKGGTASKLTNQGRALLRMYASPSAIKQVDRFKPEYVEQIGNDDKIAAEQFEYARKIGTTGVDAYDSNGNKIEFKDNDKMIQGAAWVVALQKRAGKNELITEGMLRRAGFNTSEIGKINTMAGK